MKRFPAAAAAVVFVVHLVANPHYGFFRDELYFIICGRHPQWGYVDQPPLVPLLAAMTQLGGHSLLLLRAIPALFAAGGTFVVCELAAAFGGGPFAQGLGALTYFMTPVLCSFGMKVGTDEAGSFTWPLIALCLVRLTQGADRRLWLVAGAAAGLSFEAKYSIVFFAAALAIGLALTPERRIARSRWFAAAAGIAVLIALPNVLWQRQYGWPMLELLRNGQNGKNVIPSPGLYVVQQLFITNPLIALQWIAGLVWLLRTARFRFLGYAYLALIGEMLVLHGKHYYPAAVYPILIAAGAVVLETWTHGRRIARGLVPAYVAVAGLVALPDALPVLPERTYIAFSAERAALLHISRETTETEHGRDESLLPGDWADMHGWPELAARVAAVYGSLPPRERSGAVVFAGNYGEASAVAFFEPQLPVVSEHNQFWLWGTHGASGKTLVQINGSCFHDDGIYASRTRAAVLDDPYATSYEGSAPIWICRGPKKSLADLWPQIKMYE